MAEHVCSIEGCERTDRIVRGWCSMHWQRWRRWGDPEYTLPRNTEVVHGTENGYTNRACRCPECREAHRVSYGTNRRSRALKLGGCSVPDCDGYQYAKQLCHAHYERQRTGRTLSTPLHRRPNTAIFEPYQTR